MWNCAGIACLGHFEICVGPKVYCTLSEAGAIMINFRIISIPHILRCGPMSTHTHTHTHKPALRSNRFPKTFLKYSFPFIFTGKQTQNKIWIHLFQYFAMWLGVCVARASVYVNYPSTFQSNIGHNAPLGCSLCLAIPCECVCAMCMFLRWQHWRRQRSKPYWQNMLQIIPLQLILVLERGVLYPFSVSPSARHSHCWQHDWMMLLIFPLSQCFDKIIHSAFGGMVISRADKPIYMWFHLWIHSFIQSHTQTHTARIIMHALKSQQSHLARKHACTLDGVSFATMSESKSIQFRLFWDGEKFRANTKVFGKGQEFFTRWSYVGDSDLKLLRTECIPKVAQFWGRPKNNRLWTPSLYHVARIQKRLRLMHTLDLYNIVAMECLSSLAIVSSAYFGLVEKIYSPCKF